MPCCVFEKAERHARGDDAALGVGRSGEHVDGALEQRTRFGEALLTGIELAEGDEVEAGEDVIEAELRLGDGERALEHDLGLGLAALGSRGAADPAQEIGGGERVGAIGLLAGSEQAAEQPLGLLDVADRPERPGEAVDGGEGLAVLGAIGGLTDTERCTIERHGFRAATRAVVERGEPVQRVRQQRVVWLQSLRPDGIRLDVHGFGGDKVARNAQ